MQNATQSGKELPKGFPDDLKKFVAGTEEFKSASWFTGVCKDTGGDMGQYSTQVMHNENRLMYWTAKESERIAMWAPQVMMSKNPALIDALVAAGGAGTQMSGVDMGVEANQKAALSITDESILKGVYPNTYPLDEAADMYPPSPTCAQDLARWTTKTTSTWGGFEWSPTPDAASLAAMKKQPNADMVPDAAWTAPCAGNGVPGVLCMHAMFVNCERATPGGEDMFACAEWNTRVGKMFGGTMNWIDQNTSFSDRLGETLGGMMRATPAYMGGKIFVDSFTFAWDTVAGPLGDLVAFVKDPSDVIDSWANKFKSSAMSMTDSVLPGLAGIGEFDPLEPQFLTVYAMSTGVGAPGVGYRHDLRALQVSRRKPPGRRTRQGLLRILARRDHADALRSLYRPIRYQSRPRDLGRVGRRDRHHHRRGDQQRIDLPGRSQRRNPGRWSRGRHHRIR